MSLAEMKDRAYLAAVRAVSRQMAAETVERRGHLQMPMTVTAVVEVNDAVRRLTFTAPELRDFVLGAPDEYFGLIFPRPGAVLSLPDAARGNVRAAIAAMPEDEQPDLRWYTVRELRPEVGEIDVDIVTHGESGPGSAWALRAAPGDVVGFRSSGALYRGFEVEGSQLLVADETAVPALWAILRERAARGLRGDDLRVHVEAPSGAILEGMGLEAATAAGDVTVHVRGDGTPGSAVIPALVGSTEVEGLEYAWLCGESALATGLRRHLVKEVAMDRRQILFSGYWKLGAARG